jgi:hypothetical protein
MLYFFRLLLLLINIDQETVLNWFGMEDPTTQEIRQAIESGYDFKFQILNHQRCFIRNISFNY